MISTNPYTFRHRSAVNILNTKKRLWAGIAQSVKRTATCWAVRRSNPGAGELFHTRSDRPRVPTQPPAQWVPGFCLGVKRPERGVDYPPNLVPRLE